VIALPPVLEGALQVIDAEALEPVAAPIVGAPGTVAGVTAFEALEKEPVPTTLMAATVKVYVSPLVRPLTVQFMAVLVVDVGQALVEGVDVVVLCAVTV
jgi:hypothetical protein